jgi:chemotaxis protein histidine kinase CheA
MKRVASVLSKTEDACKGLLEAVSAVKEKRVRVEVSEFTVFLAESDRLQRLLAIAVNEEEEEDEEEVMGKPVKEKQKKAERKGGDKAVAVGGVARSQRVKKVFKKQQEAEEEEEMDEVKSKPQRKRVFEEQRDEEERDEGEEEAEGEEEEEVVLPVVKKAKGKVKNGGVVFGPEGELIFYNNKRGSHGADCPVYGKDRDEHFENKMLAPCNVSALKEAELDWACERLFEMFADHGAIFAGG